MKKKIFSRRRFLGATGSAITLFNIIPAHVLAGKNTANNIIEELPPSEKLNLAFIGADGRATANIKECSSQNVYALCDVDTARYTKMAKEHPSAKLYQDWRVMLDKEAKNIDAVVVTTPDHMHALPAIVAMKMGKHVYCEKPLSRTISEARLMAKVAREYKVCTQMGNQGHAAEGARLTNEWMPAIGEVRQVHCWTNRPIWPQDLCTLPEEDVPATLDWEKWLGVATARPYNIGYAPFKWRGWYDFGAGALGDMGAHIMDHPVWALALGAPVSVEMTNVDRKTTGSEKETFPQASAVVFEFAARGKQPPVTLTWYDGGLKPEHPEKLEKERKLAPSGVIYYGAKHAMMHGSHGGAPRIFPETEMQSFERPAPTMERSSGHYKEWFEAIKRNDMARAKSNFDYAGPLTETMLLGCLAQRMGPNVKLNWDSAKMTTNNTEANSYINHEYRKGWTI